MVIHLSALPHLTTRVVAAPSTSLQPLAVRLTAIVDQMLTALGDGPAVVSGDVDTSVLARMRRDPQPADLLMHWSGRR